jgi:hypothetical protein
MGPAFSQVFDNILSLTVFLMITLAFKPQRKIWRVVIDTAV